MALTTKQKTFCQNIVAGMNNKDAYFGAYNSKGSDQNAWNEASRLLLRDDIQDYIKSLNKPIEQAVQTKVLTEREQRKQLINERILDCVNRDDDAAIARYMDILNKMDGEYININKNIDDTSPDIKNVDTTTLLRLVE